MLNHQGMSDMAVGNTGALELHVYPIEISISLGYIDRCRSPRLPFWPKGEENAAISELKAHSVSIGLEGVRRKIPASY